MSEGQKVTVEVSGQTTWPNNWPISQLVDIGLQTHKPFTATDLPNGRLSSLRLALLAVNQQLLRATASVYDNGFTDSRLEEYRGYAANAAALADWYETGDVAAYTAWLNEPADEWWADDIRTRLPECQAEYQRWQEDEYGQEIMYTKEG